MLSVMGVMCTLNTLSELPETHEHLDDARLLEQRGWSSHRVSPGSYSSLGLSF